MVQRYESFWSIAEDALGDARWHEIVAFNKGHQVAPGEVFDGTANRLLPGWELLIPSASHRNAENVAGIAEPTYCSGAGGRHAEPHRRA